MNVSFLGTGLKRIWLPVTFEMRSLATITDSSADFAPDTYTAFGDFRA